MELLQGESFYELFDSFTATAFHLEVQDSYHTPDESGPFQLFLAGQQDDLAWHQPWLDIVGEATASGRRISRVRVVTVPHGNCTRWGLSIASHNIAAGEGIRWLPRHLADPTALTSDDYWLFDEGRVVFTVFEPSGRFGGGAATRDPRIVSYCREVRDRVWAAAIPHAEYVRSEYVSV